MITSGASRRELVYQDFRGCSFMGSCRVGPRKPAQPDSDLVLHPFPILFQTPFHVSQPISTSSFCSLFFKVVRVRTRITRLSDKCFVQGPPGQYQPTLESAQQLVASSALTQKYVQKRVASASRGLDKRQIPEGFVPVLI